MSEAKKIQRAKVILKGAKTYTHAGRKFVKDVPVIIKGSLCNEFKSNGYFKYVEIEPKEVKKAQTSGEGLAPAKKKAKNKSSSKNKNK